MPEENEPAEPGSAICPSCERWIGTADVCPYCQADSAKLPMLRVLRYGALLLAVAGLGALYVAARYRELPVIRIDEITPLMNYAYVRVAGTVERNAYVARRNGQVSYLSFSVNDGTGPLRVAAYRDVAEALAGRNMVPAAGMRVDAAGSLSVQAGGNVRLILQSAEQLKTVPPR